MKQKKRTAVSEFVTDWTMFHNGKYCHYASIRFLKHMIEKICEIDECPQEYIRITPFYKHAIREFNIELDEYMGFIEITERELKPKDVRAFREENGVGVPYENTEAQYNLVNTWDTTEFHASLGRYMEFLYGLIPRLALDIQESRGLSEDELLLGEFCFEIHCE
ncbi:MAG: hypothetical protein IJD06_02195 [Clostridia bacterium]|nr:hypothetical protein [Clostridia bacterium]